MPSIYTWGMHIGGEARLRLLIFLGIALYVASFYCLAEAGQSVDPAGLKVISFLCMAAASGVMLLAWYLSHRDSDGSDRSALYERLARLRADAKLRRGQCRQCHKVLPDDTLDRFCSENCERDYLAKATA